MFRSKNATTAAAQMGMPVLDRPHALLLGAHEDDLYMTQGMEGGELMSPAVLVREICLLAYIYIDGVDFRAEGAAVGGLSGGHGGPACQPAGEPYIPNP